MANGRRTILLMAGFPGSGKSTLALAIGHALSWPVIDKDTFKSKLLESGLPESSSGPLAYDLMFAAGEDLLRQGLSVILDSPLGHARTLNTAYLLAARIEASVAVVFCRADASTRDRRMRQRPASASRPSGLAAPGGNPSWTFDHLPQDTLIVDTSNTAEDVLPRVLAYLRGEADYQGNGGYDRNGLR